MRSSRTLSFNHVSLFIVECASVGLRGVTDDKSVGKRVHLHHCQPGFSRSVHSRRSQQTHRMNRPRQNGSGSLSQPLQLLRSEVCFLGPSSASCIGPSCVTTCRSNRTRQQSKSHLSRHFLRLSCPCLSLCLLTSAFITLSIDA